MRHNSLAGLVLLGMAFACASTLTGCASPEEQAYKRARMTDTVVAWEDFLRRYPAGEETAKARQRLAELHEDREWQRAGLANRVAAYQQYLRGYPQGRYANEALARIATLNLQEVPDHDPTPEELGKPSAPAPLPASASAPAPASRPTALIQRSTAPAAKPAPRPAAKPAPRPAAKPATPPAPATPVTRVTPATGAHNGDWSVQLGAFSRGEAAARAHWSKLAKSVQATAGLDPEVVAPAEGRPFHRLRVTGLARDQARELCVAIRATGEGCVVTAP